MKVLFLILVVLWLASVFRLAYLAVRMKKRQQRRFEQDLTEFTASFDALDGIRSKQDDIEAQRRIAAAKLGRAALRDGTEL